jgi:hypothetical protein
MVQDEQTSVTSHETLMRHGSGEAYAVFVTGMSMFEVFQLLAFRGLRICLRQLIFCCWIIEWF